MTIEAKVIADSIEPRGTRLTTLQLKYPRFIHSEFMTHRMFSRNASSSRAIPVEKMLEENCNALPIHWGKNKPGMQADKESYPEIGQPIWTQARQWAKTSAHYMHQKGLHKQIVNRLTEPFQHINVIVTATEWENFFKLRLHPDAQPEIQELARIMKEAMDRSIVRRLKSGEWHLPYIQPIEFCFVGTEHIPAEENEIDSWETAIKCSVARCARVSYLNHDQTKPTIEKDIALYDRLLSSGHMSPFEHIATPFRPQESWMDIPGITHTDKLGNLWSNNFRNWAQYRALL